MSELDGDWGWLVGDEILESTSGDVLTKKSGEVISVALLGKLDGDWCWLVGDQVLESTSGDIISKESGEVVSITLLGKLDSDWCWLISHEVLEGTSGHVLTEKSGEIVGVRLVDLSIQLNETLSDWGIRVSYQVHKGLLGDVLTIELTNEGSWVWRLVLPVSNLVIWAVVSIVIRETLIESLGQSLLSIVWILEGWWGLIFWNSLDHHADSDVVVIGWIFLLISVLLQDGVEGIVSNNLSETLKSNRLNSVEVVSWGNLQSDGLNLINWDIDWHGVSVEVVLSLGLDEGAGGWGSGVRGNGCLLLSLHEGLWSMLVVMLLSLLVMVLLVLVSLFNQNNALKLIKLTN